MEPTQGQLKEGTFHGVTFSLDGFWRSFRGLGTPELPSKVAVFSDGRISPLWADSIPNTPLGAEPATYEVYVAQAPDDGQPDGIYRFSERA